MWKRNVIDIPAPAQQNVGVHNIVSLPPQYGDQSVPEAIAGDAAPVASFVAEWLAHVSAEKMAPDAEAETYRDKASTILERLAVTRARNFEEVMPKLAILRCRGIPHGRQTAMLGSVIADIQSLAGPGRDSRVAELLAGIEAERHRDTREQLSGSGLRGEFIVAMYVRDKGIAWLNEQVLCNGKYGNLSEVPDDELRVHLTALQAEQSAGLMEAHL